MTREILSQAAGVCVDFSHLEETRLLNSEIYQNNLEMIRSYPRGCAHLSAVENKEGVHFLSDLSQMDYLKNYPVEMFPLILAVELENPLARQLEVIDYIKKML